MSRNDTRRPGDRAERSRRPDEPADDASPGVAGGSYGVDRDYVEKTTRRKPAEPSGPDRR